MDPLQDKSTQGEPLSEKQAKADEASASEPPPGKGSSEQESPKPSNEYEDRVEQRRERLESAAANARAKSEAHYERSNDAIQHIPLGQPILLGHHSERRHRRDIERSHNAMDRSLAESKKAEDLERRASRVGKGGISSDDPEAIKKLEDKLHTLEGVRETMKRVNREFRKGGWDAVSGLSEFAKGKLGADMARMPSQGESPYPSYALSNLGANIRRVRARIEELAASSQEPEREEVCGAGFVLEESKEHNRIRFVFDKKPKEEVRSLLKSEGFRWSRKFGAWQRQATAAGWAAAERVRLDLDDPEESALEQLDAKDQEQQDTLSWVRTNGRDEVIARIRIGLNGRSDRPWSVTGGRGTSHGWLQIEAPPKRRTFDHRPTDEIRGDGLPAYELIHVGKDGNLMGPDDRVELARLLGFPEEDSIPHQGVKVASGHDYYAEFIDRAEGRTPHVTGTPYWD